MTVISIQLLLKQFPNPFSYTFHKKHPASTGLYYEYIKQIERRMERCPFVCRNVMQLD